MGIYTQFFRKWFSIATPINAKKATTNIGAGAHGVVAITADIVGTEGNDYTIEVDDTNSGDDDVGMTATLTDTDILVELGTDPDANAITTIGSGTNGIVTVEVDAAGSAGNTDTIEVILGVDGGNLGAALAGTDLTVTLGMTSASAATATIGTGADGEVDIEVDLNGAAGNDYTVAVDASVATQRALSAALVDTDLTVNLATSGLAKASTSIGTGEHGSVNIEVDAAGTNGNAYTVTVDATILTQRALSAGLNAQALTVTLATTGVTNATSYIGSGENGRVMITADIAGTNGNAFTIAVATTANLNAAMTANLAGSDITVTLGTDGAGAPDNAKNTATLIAAAIQALAGVSAVATGTGAGALTVAEEGKTFTGGTNQLATVQNTATLVTAAINNGTAGLTATASGTGADSLSASEVVKNFAGGTNQLAAASNTATLVAAAINNGTAGLTATASGTGVTALALAEVQKDFAGGLDMAPDPAKNTATLVTAAINDNTVGLTATASGDGSTSLSTAVVKKNFTGGTDTGAISSVKNTATLIAAAIAALTGVTAVASGNGSTPITAAVVKKNLAGGQYATPVRCPAFIKIGTDYYIAAEAVSKYDMAGWKSGTPA
jgi:hypothetical protein